MKSFGIKQFVKKNGNITDKILPLLTCMHSLIKFFNMKLQTIKRDPSVDRTDYIICFVCERDIDWIKTWTVNDKFSQKFQIFIDFSYDNNPVCGVLMSINYWLSSKGVLSKVILEQRHNINTNNIKNLFNLNDYYITVISIL